MSVSSNTAIPARRLDLARWRSVPTILIGAGAALAALGAFTNYRQFAYSWLVAFMRELGWTHPRGVPFTLAEVGIALKRLIDDSLVESVPGLGFSAPEEEREDWLLEFFDADLMARIDAARCA